MTYRQRAIELLSNYLDVNHHTARDIIRFISDESEYKPCVFGRLNAPENLEDWDVDADKNSLGFKISFYNDSQYGHEILNLPITINGKIIGVITEVTSDTITGCVWHKKATLEIERIGNNPTGFELVCE